MSNAPLRNEKNCLNCGAEVEERFCPNCGQENTINRPSFHYLFAHFFEDLFHYDSGFWKTMKTLLFKPGIIIKEYLEGKRKKFVPPVKLYIFISFITFFLPHILPEFGQENQDGEKTPTASKAEIKNEFQGLEVAGVKHIKTVAQLDSVQNSLPENKKIPEIEYKIYQSILKSNSANTLSLSNSENGDANGVNVNKIDNGFLDFSEDGFSFGKYKNIKTAEQLDSIDHSFPKNERLGWVSKKMFYKLIEVREKERKTGEKFTTIFWDKFVNNLPKALFLYLPFFAFFLWLFHDKKKWFYYDHGIFTLYYFSFLLILIAINILLEWVFDSFSILIPLLETVFSIFIFLIFTFSFFYSFFYFFRSHSRVYRESKIISRLKSFVLFWINWIFILITLMVYTIITFFII